MYKKIAQVFSRWHKDWKLYHILYHLISSLSLDFLPSSILLSSFDSSLAITHISTHVYGDRIEEPRTKIVILSENSTTVLPRIKPFSLRSSCFVFTSVLSRWGAGGARKRLFTARKYAFARPPGTCPIAETVSWRTYAPASIINCRPTAITKGWLRQESTNPFTS
jgi:hypothetical protein